jgi:hypothetical protein
MAKFSIGNLNEQLKKQLKNTQVVKKIITYLNPPTQKVFSRLKSEMISEFRQLKVVEAIEYGPGFGDNDFAGVLGRSGDLFSFLGFKRRQKPINALITLFKKMKIRRTAYLTWVVDDFPTIDRIEEVTKDQLEWASGYSWATGLEDGIPGLGRYINAPFASMDVSESLSHYGLQKKKGSNLSTQPIKWITPFIRDWFIKFEAAGFKIAKEV